MEKILLLLFMFILLSCNEKYEYKYREMGNITSLRIDDDGQYHFSTDKITQCDISQFQILIKRDKKTKYPKLFYLQEKSNYSPEDEFIDVGYSDWQYLIKLPINYKIETFND